MNRKLVFTAALTGLVLAACGGGDINIAPQTNVADSNNTTNQGGGGSGPNPCASFNVGGTAVQGDFDAASGNCSYPDVVGAGNNLTSDAFIPALDNGGAHVFEGSLFVGETCTSDACLAANGISQGGDGPTLTIEAGATLAWQTSSDFLIINRGSRIIARGRADAPITLTSVSDVNGTVGPEDVQQWGGVVINGFGVTNKCDYTGTRGQAGFALAGECHVDAEGSAGLDESHYGGANDEDNSGELSFVVVKHTGATVGNGDELNGISFGGVGRGTVVNNLQVYSTFDDGIEMFGGSFDIDNLVALYVRDDSIDIDEGYQGTITNALVIQSETDGNHCIESDGIGSYSSLGTGVADDFIARNLNSRVTINNISCIVSPNGSATATHDPGAGWRFREGIWFEINNGLLISSFAANDQTSANDNYCLRVDDPETEAAASVGNSNLNSVIYACQETFRDVAEQTFADGEGNIAATIPDGTAVSATAMNDAGLQLLEGTVPFYSIAYVTSQVDGAAPGAGSTPIPVGSETSRDFLGAISLGQTDWTAGWTYGLDPANRGQALWFETL
ncbi:MAG: hypothetical protein R3315_02970 [Woeseiaceae bacterium]|nr:hypothetical protein [Woeseiaceae bacterium]